MIRLDPALAAAGGEWNRDLATGRRIYTLRLGVGHAIGGPAHDTPADKGELIPAGWLYHRPVYRPDATPPRFETDTLGYRLMGWYAHFDLGACMLYLYWYQPTWDDEAQVRHEVEMWAVLGWLRALWGWG